jgi:tRNA pseudouridine38-40 synthase
MKNIKLIIQYDGTRYRGWQRLSTTDKTIQGKIETVLSKITGEPVALIGAGRTDAGVHAYRQTANFKTRSSKPVAEILADCYRYLPDDILILEAYEVGMHFHARYNAREKKYLYRIYNNPFHHVFKRKYIYHVPEPIDFIKIKNAATFFVGKHDFGSFTSQKLKKKTTVREIYNIDLQHKDNILEIYFTGNGFLYNMIRIIVGTLIDVGHGKMDIAVIPKLLKNSERCLAGPTVPPHGLFLVEVSY